MRVSAGTLPIPTNEFPLYRQYNPNAKAGAHNYTLNSNERDALVRAGWHDEGLAWYALGLGGPAQSQPSTPSTPSQPSEPATVPGAISPGAYCKKIQKANMGVVKMEICTSAPTIPVTKYRIGIRCSECDR